MKNILSVILALVVAIVFSSLFMKRSEENTIQTVTLSQLKAIQLGAYDTLSEANNNLKEDAIVIKDDKYYVYISILSDQANIERMIKYLNDKKIYYYIKDIDASSKFLEELYKYEEMMKSTNADVAFLTLNKKILKLYRSYYEN